MAYDVVKRADDLAAYLQWFCLSPKQWAACNIVPCGQWQSVRFQRNQRQNVPQVRGLYAFVLRPTVPAIFELGYLLYFGQTGHGNARTLYDRFDDYFQPTKIRKRARIARMMDKWQDHLMFYFVDLTNVQDLKTLETAFNDAMIPPFVSGDFSPAIREAVRAFP
jgi:hypothetical protein